MDGGFRQGMRTVYLGLAGNVLLTAVKLAAGAVSRSQALVADGVHGAVDMLGSLAVWAGVTVARVPADEEHPYGHQKAESVAKKLVAIFLILAGLEILLGAVRRTLAGHLPTPGWVAVPVLALSLVVKEILYRLSRRAGMSLRSKALLAGAQEHRADVYASLAALVGVTGARAGLPALDPLAAGVVAVFILRAGWDMLREAVDDLMDRVGDRELLAGVAEVVRAVPGVRALQGMRGRSMGHQVLLDMEIGVDGEITVREGHEVARRVRERVMAAYQEVAAVHVHVNPVTGGQQEAARDGANPWGAVR